MIAGVTRDDLINFLATRLVEAPRDRPFRVAINGPVAVGKSHFTGDLCTCIEALGRTTRTVSVDAFLQPRSKPTQPQHVYLYEKVLDLELLRDRVLVPLGPGGECSFVRGTIDRESGQEFSVESERCPRDAIFIVDGVLLLRPIVCAYWDCRIYLDAPLDVAMERAVERDLKFRQFPDDEAVRANYRARFAPLHRHYERLSDPTRNADILIDYSDLHMPRILS